MAQIIRLEDYNRSAPHRSSRVIKKLVDGKIVECVDFEQLSPGELSQLLATNPAQN